MPNGLNDSDCVRTCGHVPNHNLNRTRKIKIRQFVRDWHISEKRPPSPPNKNRKHMCTHILTVFVVDDAKRIGMQMPEKLAQNYARVLAHQPQIPQIVLLREGGVTVWQTRRLSLVGAGRNVTHDVNLCVCRCDGDMGGERLTRLEMRWFWVGWVRDRRIKKIRHEMV